VTGGASRTHWKKYGRRSTLRGTSTSFGVINPDGTSDPDKHYGPCADVFALPSVVTSRREGRFTNGSDGASDCTLLIFRL